MNKLSITTIALALTLASGSAFATNYNHSSPTSDSSSTHAGANASVGGSVISGSGCAGNCAAGGVVIQSSTASAGSFSGAGADADYNTSGFLGVNKTGDVDTGAVAGGYAVTKSTGFQAGTATGQTSGAANFEAGADANADVDGRGLDLDANSHASVAGGAGSFVTDNGKSFQGTAAIAGNTSTAGADKSASLGWKGITKTANVDGSSAGLSASLSAGYTSGNGTGSAESQAVEYGSADAEADNYRADAEGFARQNSTSDSSNVDTGIAGSGTIGKAGFEASASNRKGWFSEYSSADATAYQKSASGSFEYGNGDAVSTGGAGSEASAVAGNFTANSQPQ